MDANFAHFALQKLRILPSQLLEMDEYERAFIYASIRIRVDAEKEQAKKMKAKK